MYADFFSLTEKPFSITPDPAYLFLSKRHEEALAHLIYGVTDSGGFIQLTGEVGTGKTTIIRSLFERLPENVDIALILNPRLSVNEFLHSICDELGLQLDSQASNKACIDVLNPFLLNAHAEGRKVVLLVDEAQNLSVEVLEQIRLLTNLETHKDKLLQIILVGQPELDSLLQRQDLRQLAQRITARYFLLPLNKQETSAYIKHRASVAGARYNLFKPSAEFLIYKESKGIPRLINVIADRALLGAYSQGQPTVDSGIAKQAIKEVMGGAKFSINEERATPIKSTSWLRWAWAPLLAIAGLTAWKFLPLDNMQNIVSSTDAQTQEIVSSPIQAAVAEITPEPIVKELNELSVSTKLSGNVMVSPAERDQVLGDFDSTSDEVNQADIIEIESQKSQAINENANTQAMDLVTIFQNYHTETTPETAFNQALNTWGRSQFYDHSNACESIKVLGLRCLYQQGAWQDVLKLNRPVILELQDDQAVKHSLLISAVDNDTLTVSLPSANYSLPASQVLDAWQGSYLVFWKPEQLHETGLYLWMRSDSVLWLREQLTVLGLNIEPENQSRQFDNKLVESVKAFQESVGIPADGIVGSQTYLFLNNALGLPDRPTLKKDK